MVRGTIGHLTGQGHIYAISDCIGAKHQGPTLRWVGHDYAALLSPDEEHSKGIEKVLLRVEGDRNVDGCEVQWAESCPRGTHTSIPILTRTGNVWTSARRIEVRSRAMSWGERRPSPQMRSQVRVCEVTVARVEENWRSSTLRRRMARPDGRITRLAQVDVALIRPIPD
jgi:hypothetical protein